MYIRQKQPLQRIQESRLRYLPWLSLVLLTACASQMPMHQPAMESSPSASVPDAVTSHQVAVAAEVAIALPQDAVDIVTNKKITTLRAWVDQENRLYAIAAPLLIKNASLCKQNAHYLLGFTAKTKYSYSSDFVAAAQSGLGLGERLRVMHVLPGSGAALSGVRQGDILLAVEDKPLPQGPSAERKAGLIMGETIRQQSSVKLTVMRDSDRVNIQVPLTQACAFGVEFGDADEVNSYADGRRVMITRGMLNFAQSNEELAYVLAKEIAHNMLTRSARPRMRAVIDSLRLPSESHNRQTATPQLPSYTPVLDATADKISLYLLARAGYSIDDTLRFWKRLATQYPASVQNSHTALHPSTAYRFSVMTQIVRTIELKKKNNLPLIP